MSSPVRLYIGFGGSGSKTLAAFVDILAQHAEWGDEAETHCAFVLADTDRNDLVKYEEQIRERCRRIGRDPIVRSIQTSEGVAGFQSFAAGRLEKAGHHERLRDAWWYRRSEDGRHIPFTAERLTGSPGDGAGQCPLVSSFLAWNNMDRIGEEIRSVVEQLQLRMTLLPGDQRWTLHTTIIAGLAGGTGRGCWHLLASKVREVLKGIGRETMPVGYFYDASVFGDVMAANRGQANKMRVNALTGFSELVAWMRNEGQLNPHNFALPSIDRPWDSSADVIDVLRVVSSDGKTALPGVPGQSPVNQAFVVFGGGRSGSPGRPEHYYRIVANAMYARLVREVASQAVNSAAFGGIGAATIQIPINDIREYVGQYVRKYVPENLAHSEPPGTLDEWVGILSGPLAPPKPVTFAPRSDGKLLERILSGVIAHQQQRLKSLNEGLEAKRKNKQALAEDCRRIDGWADSREGKEAIRLIAEREILEGFWGRQAASGLPGSGGLLRELGIVDVLTDREFSEIYGGDPAVRRQNPVSQALTRILLRSALRMARADGTSARLDLSGFGTKAALAAQLSKALQTLAKDFPRSPGAADSVVAELEKAQKGLFGRSITEDEAGLIREAATKRILLRSVDSIQDAVSRQLNQAAEELANLSRELSDVVVLLEDSARKVTADLAARRDQLFWTEADFSRVVSQSADGTFSSRLLSDQRLQPLANDAVLKQALDEQAFASGNERFESARLDLVELLRQWVVATESGQDPGRRRQALRRLLDEGLDGLGRSLVLGRKFYADRFGFFAVVRDLIVAWGQELSRRSGVEVELKCLRTAFEVQFGVPYPFDQDGPLPLEGKKLDDFCLEVCQGMAVALGNRCDVLFEARRDNIAGAQDDAVAVVLPAESWFDLGFADACRSLGARRGLFRKQGMFSVYPSHQKRAHGNPFCMVAYAQENFPNWHSDEGLNRVASLSYHNDPDTARWMIACEDENGMSVFTHNDAVLPAASESFGLGFISPIFVRNTQLRQLRWRPWISHQDRVDASRNAFALDVLAYALLDEPVEDADGERLLKLNERESWHLPLLNLREPGAADGRKRWEFSRSAIRDDLGRRSANHPAFKAGEGFTSIGKLMEVFSREDSPIVQAIAAEAVIYFSEVLPQHPGEVDLSRPLRVMCRDLRRRLEESRSSETGHTQAQYQDIYSRLITRVEVLADMSCENLRGHFQRRGRS
jgi:hypothetical protein